MDQNERAEGLTAHCPACIRFQMLESGRQVAACFTHGDASNPLSLELLSLAKSLGCKRVQGLEVACSNSAAGDFQILPTVERVAKSLADPQSRLSKALREQRA